MPDSIQPLIVRLKPKSPAVYEAFIELDKKITKLDESIKEVRSIVEPPVTGTGQIGDILVFNYEITKRNIRLTWEQPTPAIRSYEIRYGTDWNTAEPILTTTTTSAVFDPLPVGTHTYLIKGMDFNGVQSINATSLTFNINGPGVVTMTSQTFGSNVLLFWSVPISEFDIDYYNIKKNSVLIGQFKGTFTNLLELSGGTFDYTISAVDIAGNEGPPNTLTIVVSDPTDFELQDDLESTFAGTKTNCMVEAGKLIAPINLTEDWATHFSSRGWTTIQNQIDAGYPIYSQPSPTSATYVETFDFGVIYTNTVVSITYLSNVISDAVVVGISLEFSDDNVTYSAPVSGLVNFVESVRYVRVTVTFTADDTGLMEFYEFHVILNVHREIDSGRDIAVSTDTDGTEFLFNKAFKDVDSITLTTDTTEPVIAIYEFDDIPDPVSFFVKAFDSAGQRITYPISWKARGII